MRACPQRCNWRARRQVVVVDAGATVSWAPRAANRMATRRKAADRLPRAPRRPGRNFCGAPVSWLHGNADETPLAPDGALHFREGHQAVRARHLILASGVRDELPDAPGLAERWGRSVFHRPHCHGHEAGAGPIGIVAASLLAQHHGVMLPDWGTTTLFLNDRYRPHPDNLAALARRGTRVETVPIARIEGFADVVMQDRGRHAGAGHSKAGPVDD